MRLANRRLVEIVPEARYGIDPGVPGLFPAFLQGDQWATRDRELTSRAVSRSGFGQQRDAAGAIRGAFEPVRSFLYDQGPALLSWTLLLEAAGLWRGPDDTWSAEPGLRSSLTLRDYRDGARRRLTGCVATLSMRADFGEPVEIDATVAGRAEADEPATMPSGAMDLPEPVTLCGADFQIAVDGWPVIIPVLNQIQLDTGSVIATRHPSRAGAGALEYRVTDCLPAVRCSIEAEPGLDWEGCRGRRVQASWGLGQAARWLFDLPRLELIGNPETGRLPSGGEGVTLLLRAREGRGAPLIVRRST